MESSDLEEHLAGQIRMAGLPEPEREYKFHPLRRWRADFAWPDRKLLIDIQGGTFAQGKHNRARGMDLDHEKLNHASLLGWKVLQFSTLTVKNDTAITMLMDFFEGKFDVQALSR